MMKKQISSLLAILMMTAAASGLIADVSASGDEKIIRRPAELGQTAEFEYYGSWRDSSSIKLDDEQTNAVVSNDTEAGAYLKYNITSIEPGYYDVYDYAITDAAGTNDNDIKVTIAHNENGILVTDPEITLNSPGIFYAEWRRITSTPVYFSGTGDEYIKYARGSIDPTKYTRGGSIKLVSFDGTTITCQDSGCELTGTWTDSSTMKLSDGVTNSKYTTQTGASAKFSAAGLPPGAYTISYDNVKANEKNDTAIQMNIVHNGKTETFTFSQGGSTPAGWNTLLNGKALYFNGDGTEYVELVRTNTNTGIYTRIGAVKFTPVNNSENGVINIKVMSDDKEIPLGGYRDDKTVYNAYIPLTADSATISLELKNPMSSVTVDDVPVPDPENIEISGIESEKTVDIKVTAPDGSSEKAFSVIFERAYISDNNIAGTGYSESGNFVNGSVIFKDYLDSDTLGAARVVPAGISEESYATWQPPEGALSGKYDVYIWAANIDYPDTSDVTKIDIVSSGNTLTSYYNLRDSTDWIRLGAFTFSGDGNEYIRAYKSSGASLRTDAVKFVPSTNTADASDTGIMSILVNGKQLTINEGQTVYTTDTENLTSAPISVMPENTASTVKINGVEVKAGTAEMVYLSYDRSIVTIEITAEDGVTTQDYSLIINNYLVLDNGTQGYSEEGNWTNAPDRSGYNGAGVRMAGAPGDTAIWTVPADIGIDTEAEYDISLLCVIRDSDTVKDTVKYDISGAETKTVTVDYNDNYGAGNWIELASLQLKGDGTDTISMTKTSDTSVPTYADAVRLIKSYPEPYADEYDDTVEMLTTEDSYTGTIKFVDGGSLVNALISVQPMRGILEIGTPDEDNTVSYTYIPNDDFTSGTDTFVIGAVNMYGIYGYASVTVTREDCVVDNISITDSTNEEVVGDITAAGPYTFSAEVKTVSPKNIMLIAAEYDKSGRLVGVGIDTKEIQEGGSEILSETLNVTDAENTVKFMIWDGISYIPLINVITK